MEIDVAGEAPRPVGGNIFQGGEVKTLVRTAAALAVALLAFTAQASEYRLLVLDGQYVKWNKPSFGSGAVVRYAFAKKVHSDPAAINCRQIVPMDQLLQSSKVSEAEFEAEVHAAIAQWEAVADVEFRHVSDPEEADLIIGAQGRPRGIAYTNVSTAKGVPGQIAPIGESRICFNPLVAWEVGVDGIAETYNFRQVVAHEIGHVLGLDHPGRGGELMGFAYSEEITGLQEGDIRGAVLLYGLRVAH